MELRKDAVTSIINLLLDIHYLLLLSCHCHNCVCDLEFQLQRAIRQYSNLPQLQLVCPMTSKAYTLGTFTFIHTDSWEITQILVNVGYDSVTGVYLTLSQPDLLLQL
jgi:hypothetical protein